MFHDSMANAFLQFILTKKCPPFIMYYASGRSLTPEGIFIPEGKSVPFWLFCYCSGFSVSERLFANGDSEQLYLIRRFCFHEKINCFKQEHPHCSVCCLMCGSAHDSARHSQGRCPVLPHASARASVRSGLRSTFRSGLRHSRTSGIQSAYRYARFRIYACHDDRAGTLWPDQRSGHAVSPQR